MRRRPDWETNGCQCGNPPYMPPCSFCESIDSEFEAELWEIGGEDAVIRFRENYGRDDQIGHDYWPPQIIAWELAAREIRSGDRLAVPSEAYP